MKKLSVIALLAFTVWACHRKTATSASAQPPAQVAQSATVPPPPPPATTSASAPAASNAEAIAAGKTVYTARCGSCHELKHADAYTTKQWNGILESMIPKARLDETQSAQVTAYVMAHAKK